MILALFGLNNAATLGAAVLPSLSLSKHIITLSNDSKNSKFFLTSDTALCAPFFIDTTGHLLPVSS